VAHDRKGDVEDGKWEVPTLDPWEIARPFRWTRNISSTRLWLVGPILLLPTLLVTRIEGTLGQESDFQLWQDIRRVLGIKAPSSPAAFPLARDVLSWFLLVVVVATCVLVHRQWQYIARSITDMAASGVIRPVKRLSSSPRSRLLLLHRILGDCDPESALIVLATWVNHLFSKASRWVSWTFALLAVIFAGLLFFGGRSTGVFRFMMPENLDHGAQQEWLQAAYLSWWASSAHPLGESWFFLTAFLIVYVVLLQNLVGIVIAYGALALPEVVIMDADWLDRDGRFGWMPMVRVYRTVYLSLALHGLDLSVLLIVFSVRSFPWILGLVGLWVIVLPIYLLWPWTVYRSVEENIKKRRVERIKELMDEQNVDTESNLEKLPAYLAEIQRAREARIRPIRVPRYQIPPFAAVVLLPILLTIVQIIFS
jgi:hypothetical protein